jgi:hypothetical protein
MTPITEIGVFIGILRLIGNGALYGTTCAYIYIYIYEDKAVWDSIPQPSGFAHLSIRPWTGITNDLPTRCYTRGNYYVRYIHLG